MENIEVLITVRQHTADGYTEWKLQTPLPWVMLSTAIKRQIKKLVGVKT
jgi:hypothetical protein